MRYDQAYEQVKRQIKDEHDFKTKQESMEFRQDNQVDLINEARNKMDSKHYIEDGRNDCDMSEQRSGRLDRDAGAKTCTAVQESVSGLILDNHRMVDTASDRLDLIMTILRSRLEGFEDESCCGLNDDLPRGCIPLLNDMLGRQVTNNDTIEVIIRILEKSL